MPTPEEVAVIEQQTGDQQIPPSSMPEAPEDPAKMKEQYDNFRKLYNKRDGEISELRKAVEELKKTRTEDKSDTKVDEDKKYISGLGYLTEAELEAKLAEREKAREEARTQQEREKQVQKRAEEIRTGMKEATEKYGFIKEGELLEFMKQKPGLSVMEAAKLKYEEEFDKLKTAKGSGIPETDTPGKGGISPEPQKILKFGNRKAMSDSIRETVRNAAEVK